MEILDTISYNEEFSAWEIKSTGYYSINDPCQLKYYYKGFRRLSSEQLKSCFVHCSAYVVLVNNDCIMFRQCILNIEFSYNFIAQI